MPSDKTLDVRPGSIDSTSMRYHELWLQRWLYSRFFVREGYPIPVVFSTPMDAFSHFNKLWADVQNPFAYLLNVKDEQGTPLYEPHPSPVRYPLISVMRKGIKYRSYQNFSIHSWRHVNWPTISDADPVIPGKEQIGTDLTKCNLGNVTTSRMPMAFDYRFQIDHFCLRPDTQAFFIERLITQFWRTGGSLQSWMDIEYPGWGTQYIRIYLDGDIDQSVPEEYQDKQVEFRTSFTLVVEGFSIDLDYKVKPALWKLIPWSGTPDELTDLLRVQLEVDLRETGTNLVLESRSDIPAAGTCASDLLYASWNTSGTAVVSLGGQVGTNAASNVLDGNQIPVVLPTDVIDNTPPYAYGIPSTLEFGYGSVHTGTYVWLSGSVTAAMEPGTPGTEGVAIIVQNIGTFYTDATGSYAGLVYVGYSGTATPFYELASQFSPTVRVYDEIAADTPDQDYAWFAFADPWISGTVTPPATGIGIEFPAVGTFAVDATTGSYAGTVPYGYSGTAVPQYWGAESFTPPVRVYEALISDSPDQDYTYTPLIHFRGTESVSGTIGFGNVPTYNLYNFINAGTTTASAFGTYVLAAVPTEAGTYLGTFVSEVFGTYLENAVVVNAGTEYGTNTLSAVGTYTLVVEATSAGTYYGTVATSVFGTATQVVVAVSTGTYAGTVTAAPFGSYDLA